MREMDEVQQEARGRHDAAAPWWAATLVILCVTGLATNWIDFSDHPTMQSFWKGYVLDMAGPAWTYILIRGLFTAWRDTPWARFFQPGRTFILCVGALSAIELMQYLQWYDATFDPWDLLAYISLLGPVYLVDRFLYRPFVQES